MLRLCKDLLATAFVLFVLVGSVLVHGQTPAVEPLDLTGIVSADVQRKDAGPNIRVVITINLMGGGKFTTDFFLDSDDIDAYKNGNAATRNAMRKKYIRLAVKNYRASIPSPAEADGGTATVPKANFSDPGDTNP